MNNQDRTHQTMDAFLASVEGRAYKHAYYAVRNQENALDIVQNSMLNLVQSYSDRPSEEWPMLFTRILQNAVHSHFRYNRIREHWTPTFSTFEVSSEDEANYDILETLLAKNSYSNIESAEESFSREQMLNLIEKLIKDLPARQREAFLFRYWEDYSVTETAQAMGCSEGSVKTHCSRATHSLAKSLNELGITHEKK